MFTFYKFDVVGPGNWTATFLKDEVSNNVTKIKNDKQLLQNYLSNTNYLVGYNNYKYCDRLIASVLKDTDPYETLQRINSNKRVTFNLQSPISIDLSQELRVELNEIKLNLGYNIDFSDLETMKQIFKLREDYLSSKFEVVNEFKLKADNVKRTRVMLASEVLKTRKGSDRNRLNVKYDKRLPKHELPKSIIEFYKNIENEFKKGTDFKVLEREQFVYKIAGLDHVYGFGGLHAAKENYVGSGNYMQIDVALIVGAIKTH